MLQLICPFITQHSSDYNTICFFRLETNDAPTPSTKKKKKKKNRRQQAWEEEEDLYDVSELKGEEP